MEESSPDILTDSLLEFNPKSRKELLPWWIKVFSWMFLVLGAIAIIGFISGILGRHFALELFGLSTNDPLSAIGLFVLSLFLFKGIVALGMIMKKNWAILLGIIDAGFSLFICIAVMLYPMLFPDSDIKYSFRGEIIILVPYLLRLIKINPVWKSSIEI